MHERDRNRSLAHARRHTLDRTVPNVTHDKDAGNICLQEPWLAIEFPAVGPFAAACELRTGIDKAQVVALDDVCEPVCVWRCSDHDEERVGGYFVYFVRLGAMNRNRLEVIFAIGFHDGGVVFDLNVWSSFELI